jgi:hypothetical protein
MNGSTQTTPDVTDLVTLVAKIVRESGDPDGFDPAVWVHQWLNTPCPALGNALPATYLDTAERRTQVVRLILQIQSGTYA